MRNAHSCRPDAARQTRIFVGAVVVAGASMWAQPAENRLTVPFSDPSRPGTVRVSLMSGGLRVTASSSRDVVVTSSGVRVRDQAPAKALGLRRLSQPGGLTVTENDNVISIGSGRIMGSDDVQVQVPARSNLKLSTVNGDHIEVDGIEGDVEATAVNGGITVTNAIGTVIAHATNDDVRVVLTRVTPGKPMAFTSLNGDIDVTLPAAVKANLKLLSNQGEIFTDFDVQIRERPAPAAAAPPPALAPLPPLAPETLRELARQARELARQASRGFGFDSAVHGSINGGGAEFELRTFNGNIYLRRGK